jgi:hypothetical protein
MTIILRNNLIACYNPVLVTYDNFLDPNARSGYNQRNKPHSLRYFNSVLASQFINNLGRKAAQIQRCAGGLISTQRLERSSEHSLMLLTCCGVRGTSACLFTRYLHERYVSPLATCKSSCLSARYLQERMSLRSLLARTHVSLHSLLAKTHSSPSVICTNTCLSAR